MNFWYTISMLVNVLSMTSKGNQIDALYVRKSSSYKSCHTDDKTSNNAHLKSVTIEQCDSNNICYCSSSSHPHQTITLRIAFQSHINASSIHFQASVKMVNKWIRLKSLDRDLCLYNDISCPIYEKDNVEFVVRSTVEDVFLKNSMLIQFNVMDEKRNELVCFNVNLKCL